jgi:energy-coupling factor transport system substrate-specific component
VLRRERRPGRRGAVVPQVRIATVLAALAALAAAAWAALDPDRAGLALLLVAVATIVGAGSWLEGGPGSARELTLVAALAGLAAAGRVLFAAVPGVQPVTVVAVTAGGALGLRAGIAVGGLAALASNFFLGQGIWTPWQMLAWGACGAVGALLGPALRNRFALAFVCFVLGFAFSALMDLWEWFSFFPHTWQALAVQMSRGFPFQAAHAVGNVLIALAVGPELRRVLERYERGLSTEVVWGDEPVEVWRR